MWAKSPVYPRKTDTQGFFYSFSLPKNLGAINKEKTVNKYQNILAGIYRIAIPGHHIRFGVAQIQDRPSSFYE